LIILQEIRKVLILEGFGFQQAVFGGGGSWLLRGALLGGFFKCAAVLWKTVCNPPDYGFAAAFMNWMLLLRAVSLTEGVSYLVLLLVAMPMKYVWDQPLAVKWVGWAHGVLFMALGVLLLLAMWRASLSLRLAVMVGVAALLPGGPFFVDRHLRRHQASLTG